MYQLSLLNTLLKDYKLWTIKLTSSSNSIKNNILQTDQTGAMEQKIMSIGISMGFVYLCTSIVGLFGVYTGGFLAGVILFAIGWFLSKIINIKLFGTPRKEEDLKDDEKALFAQLQTIQNRHISIRDNMKKNSITVHFTEYPILKKEFTETLFMLENYNTKHLAFKYRASHKIVVSQYNQRIKKFHLIYAHKK
jgi:hypothetical protein